MHSPRGPAGASGFRGAGQAGDRLDTTTLPRSRGVARGGESEGSVGDAPSSAVDIDRDAKASSEALRELLKSQLPWSREVEFHRQKSRNFYLTLLFAYPLSTHAQSLDPLWLNTSYCLIASYRDHVSRAEAILPPKRKKGGRMSEPEYRKVITRFRQALTSEESFYRGLIGRIVGFYQLQEFTRSHLSVLNIAVPDGFEGGGEDHGLAPIGKEEAREKVALVYKALICLGDLERYKDQYGERARREREGIAGKNLARDRDELYAKARTYYEVARGLLPDDGSAFNQLAVISTYLADDFQTTYYYFRALAVRAAFKNGAEILDRFFKKNFDRWRAASEDDLTTDQVERCKREILIVTSIIFGKSGLSQLRNLISLALPSFSELLNNRLLPSEIIVKVTVIAIGAHWHARQSASLVSSNNVDATAEIAIKRRRLAEEAAVDFVLSLDVAMLDIAAHEVEEAVPQMEGSALLDDTEDDTALHSHITAVLRRILPALRILSKWVKLHLDYLSRFSRHLSITIQHFWSSYNRFIKSLGIVFPFEMLPSLSEPLEEDDDMRGFLPLSRGLSSGRGDVNRGQEQREFHPNEEQLMRISDLQVDAKLINQTLAGSAMERHSVGFAGISHARSEQLRPSFAQPRDDELASVSTETEDDPVNLAMRATLAEDSVNGDERDEEVILWEGQGSKALKYTPSAFSTTAAQPPTAFDLLQNLMLESTLPSHGSTHTTSPSAIPQKLSPAYNPSSAAGEQGSQGSPGLLFGGDGGIWQMTREESEKGAKRAERVKESQKEAIKAIWADSPVPHHSTEINGRAPTVPPPLPGPSGLSAGHATTGVWGSINAASLFAGMSTGWQHPQAPVSVGADIPPPLAVLPSHRPSVQSGPAPATTGWRGSDPIGAYQQYGPQQCAQWTQSNRPP